MNNKKRKKFEDDLKKKGLADEYNKEREEINKRKHPELGLDFDEEWDINKKSAELDDKYKRKIKIEDLLK